jgi:hypothetical protein
MSAKLSDILAEKIKQSELGEEQNAALLELCILYYTNPIAFAIKLKDKEWRQSKFGDIAVKYIEAHVKKILDQAAPAKVDLENDDEIVAELIRLAKRNATLWHNEYKVGYGTVKRDGHIENLQVERQEFQHFLQDKFGEEWQREVDGELGPTYAPQRCIKSSLYHIENHARQGDERDPKIRIAAHNEELWIDSGDRHWSAIRVTADGWRKEEAENVRIKYLRHICRDPALPFVVRIKAALEAQSLETNRMLNASRRV